MEHPAGFTRVQKRSDPGIVFQFQALWLCMKEGDAKAEGVQDVTTFLNAARSIFL
jgi:hypothetical protein